MEENDVSESKNISIISEDDFISNFYDQLNEVNIYSISKKDLIKEYLLSLGIPEEYHDNIEDYIEELEDNENNKIGDSDIRTIFNNFFIRVLRALYIKLDIKFNGENITFNKVYTVYKVLILNFDMIITDFINYYQQDSSDYTLHNYCLNQIKKDKISTENLFEVEDPLSYIKNAAKIKNKKVVFTENGMSTEDMNEEEINSLITEELYNKYFEQYVSSLFEMKKEDIDTSIFEKLYKVNPSEDYRMLNSLMNITFEMSIGDLDIYIDNITKKWISDVDIAWKEKIKDIIIEKTEIAQSEIHKIKESINKVIKDDNIED